jgi:hypothetical protein
MNRRSLLGRLAAVAAAVSLAPAAKAEAAPQVSEASGRVRYPGDTDISQRCVGCGWEGEWSNEVPTLEMAARSVAEFDRHVAQEHGGVEQIRDGIWRPHDPLATAQRIREAYRDGYERAEFVKAMREESRAGRAARERVNAWRLGLHEQARLSESGYALTFRNQGDGDHFAVTSTEFADHVRATVKYYEDAGLI